MKPTFLIMGAQKGGTTSLYDVLTRHPMMGRATKKELHFFDRFYDRGWDWYEQRMPLSPRESQIGEATPAYMYDAGLRDLIADTLPDIKVVITLRDPVARAYSHYWHSRRYNREPLETFEEAIEAEPGRLSAATRRNNLRRRLWWSYVDRGRYVDQLEAIEKRYGRDAICVVTLEETKRDPQTQVSRVLRHLRLDPDLMPDFSLPSKNSYHQLSPKELRRMRADGVAIPSAAPSSYPPLAPQTREALQRVYAEDNARLQSWLGRPVPWPIAPSDS